MNRLEVTEGLKPYGVCRAPEHPVPGLVYGFDTVAGDPRHRRQVACVGFYFVAGQVGSCPEPPENHP